MACILLVMFFQLNTKAVILWALMLSIGSWHLYRSYESLQLQNTAYFSSTIPIELKTNQHHKDLKINDHSNSQHLEIFNNATQIELKTNQYHKDLKINDNSNFQRLKMFNDAIQLFMSSPIIGKGVGYFISSYYYEPDGHLTIHNTLLWIATELGLIGLAAFLMLYGHLIIGFVNTYKEYKAKLIPFLLGHFIFLSFSLVHEVLYQRIFWVFCAVTIYPLIYKQSQKYIIK